MMESEQPTASTKPTALQTTSVAATRPKLIIGTSFIIVLIVILLEIYAPREKNEPPDSGIQANTPALPAATEPSDNDATSKNP
jgi:hypothetical protein